MDIVRASSCPTAPRGLGPADRRHRRGDGPGRAALALVALWLALPVGAQGVPYKVTGPDGRVTYTDRPPADARSVHALGVPASSAPLENQWLEGLPFTLRQTAQRYPVTLYTGDGCVPCDQGRQVLQQRGIPFREWRVQADGSAELQRREGTTSLPVLRLGRQQLVGYEAEEWQRTLDAAGYPPSSALPPAWRPPAVQPLAAAPASAAEGAARAVPAPSRAVVPPPVAPAPASSAKSFRF